MSKDDFRAEIFLMVVALIVLVVAYTCEPKRTINKDTQNYMRQEQQQSVSEAQYRMEQKNVRKNLQ